MLPLDQFLDTHAPYSLLPEIGITKTMPHRTPSAQTQHSKISSLSDPIAGFMQQGFSQRTQNLFWKYTTNCRGAFRSGLRKIGDPENVEKLLSVAVPCRCSRFCPPGTGDSFHYPEGNIRSPLKGMYRFRV